MSRIISYEMKNADQKMSDRLAVLKELTDRMEKLLRQSTDADSCWSIKQVAKSLGCSERTVRRRIKADARFPKPMPSSSYEDRGRVRTTQPRWNSADIVKYKNMCSSK